LQYLTTKQVAAILNVCPKQVLNFCHLPENPLPHRHPSTRIYRFVEEEVVIWFEQFMVGEPEEDYNREAFNLAVPIGRK